MALDNYDPSTSKTAYYPAGSDRPARLWATEHLLQTLGELGAVEYFEGAGTDPTGLSGYSTTKLWLQVSAGVTTTQGTVRAYVGSGTASSIANWPELTREALYQHLAKYTLTGEFASPDARIYRFADRMFGGLAAGFGGEWGSKSTLTGLNTYARAVHDWAFRDGDFIWDSVAGSMAIVGHSQASKWTTYPGNPTYHPVSIGVSGFSLNDVSGGVGYGGYFDAVRDGGGFTVSVELACANLGAETTPTPWNILTGGIEGGVAVWSQSGCGLDLVYEQYDRAKSIAAHQVYLTSYRPTGGAVYWDLSTAYVVGRVAFDGTNNYCCLSAHTSPASGTFADYRTANPSHWQLQKTGSWLTSTAYVIGDLANDTVSGVTFRCAVAHTSASSGTFAAARAANTTYWKQLPSAKKGRVIAAGGVEEESAGTNLFIADDMPLGHKYRWSDSSAATKAELWGGDLGLVASSFLTNIIYTDATSAGGPYVQLTRVSATPAASDGLGGTIYAGYNASAAQVNYVSEVTYILDTTAGSEDAEWAIAPMVAGATPFAIKVGNGVQIGSPTGGYKGTGHLNAVALYEDGTALDAKYGRLGSTNTWSAANTFQLSDNGAAIGPTLILDRLSTSPAASDGIGSVQYKGRDSGGNTTTYGEIYGAILDPTDTTEDSMIGVSVMVAGTYTAAIAFGDGVTIGSPAGSFKGAGTLNVAGDIYKNNTAYTNPDYVFEREYTGQIVQFADREGAAAYQGRMSLDDLRTHTRTHLRLPGITDDPLGAFKRSDVILEKLEELTLYVLDLHDRINVLETAA